MLKNVFVYYLLIFLPLGVLVLATKDSLLSSAEFTIGIAVYALLYHPLISGLRLVAGRIIGNEEIWKVFIPFWTLKYFTFLFFNKSGFEKVDSDA